MCKGQDATEDQVTEIHDDDDKENETKVSKAGPILYKNQQIWSPRL